MVFESLNEFVAQEADSSVYSFFFTPGFCSAEHSAFGQELFVCEGSIERVKNVQNWTKGEVMISDSFSCKVITGHLNSCEHDDT